MFEHYTTLTREGAASLKPYCADLRYDGDLYGHPLNSLVGEFEASWLEATLLAGYVPNCDAVVLVMRAYHLWWQEVWTQEARELFEQWTHVADVYRDIIAMLEGFVIEVEEKAEATWGASSESSSDSERDERTRAARARMAAAERLKSVQNDNRQAASVWSRAGRPKWASTGRSADVRGE